MDQRQHCSVCQHELEDGSETNGMKCSHVFHKGCFDRMCQVSGVDPGSADVYEVSCPECKKTALELSDAESQLMKELQEEAGLNESPIEFDNEKMSYVKLFQRFAALV